MAIDIAAAAAWAQMQYETILDTAPDNMLLQWWSARLGEDYQMTKKPTYTRHPTYPTIPVLVGPIGADDDFMLGLGTSMSPTHQGSTKIGYLTEAALAPVASGDQDYRIKPMDKLVDDQGAILYVTETVPSTARVKVVLGLRREDPRESELA